MALTAPADGAHVRGSVTISVTAQDDTAVDHVDFQVNDVVVGSDTTDFPYATSWDSTSLADGPATISAVAVDTSGNRTTSASRTVTNDNTPPDTTIDSGPSGTRFSIGHVRVQRQRDRLDLRLHARRWSPGGVHSPKAYSGLAEGAHTFTVRATDPAGNPDPTPASRTWTVETTPPDTTIDSGPSGTLGSASATFAFSASETGSTFACTLDGGAPAGCTSPKAYSGLAEGAHTFTVRATDPAGNPDPTPASRTWTVDTTPPDTTIDSGPVGHATSDSATFAFSASETGSTFGCTLDGGAPAGCTSPKAYSGLAEGAHTFTVRATDPAGNPDPTPASRTWTVDTQVADTTPPTVALTAPADGAHVRGSVTISVTAQDDTAVDHVDFQVNDVVVGSDTTDFPYATSWDSTSLADGPATISAVAVDTSGNRTTSASRTVTNDNTPPDTTIDSGPSGTLGSASATFAFSASETGSTFACTLDGGAPAGCTSPKAYSGLAEGAHTFTVRATDPAGNPDPTPASRTWTVDTTPPTAPLISSPPEGRQIASGTVDLAGSAEASATIALFEGATARGTTTASGGGNWSLSLSGVPDGAHTYTATATDPVGNTSGPSAGRTITVDTTAPDTTRLGSFGHRDLGHRHVRVQRQRDRIDLRLHARRLGRDRLHLAQDVQRPAEGLHSFTVRASDPAGNPDPTPVSRTWTVDLQGGSTLFTDGFKSGSFSAWTSVGVGGDGTAIVQGSTVKTGAFAARFSETVNTGSLGLRAQDACVDPPGPDRHRGLPCRCRGRQRGQCSPDPGVRCRRQPPRFPLSTEPQRKSARLDLRRDPFHDHRNAGAQHVGPGLPAARGRRDGREHTIQVRLNGTLVYQTTTATFTTGVRVVQIGNETNKQAGTIFVDNVQAVDSAGAPEPPSNSSVPAFDHIFVVVEENKRFDQIIGSSSAPYINSLAARYGLAANYKPITHPSLPNYLALIGGSTFGITTDCNPTGTGACPVNATNLADRIDASGRTWRGSRRDVAAPRRGPSGRMSRATTRSSTSTTSALTCSGVSTTWCRSPGSRPTCSQPRRRHRSRSSSPTSATTCTTARSALGTTGCRRTWRRSSIRRRGRRRTRSWSSPSTKTTRSPGDQGNVVTILVGPSVRKGLTWYANRNHYSLVRTIEDAWSLAPLTANDTAASPMTEFLTTAHHAFWPTATGTGSASTPRALRRARP